MNLKKLTRKNVRELKPYQTARDEFKGLATIFLDANENPFPSAFNRYPDPHQSTLKKEIAAIKGVASKQLILGNGSDEIIDLLLRAFCDPGVDNVIIPQPTYGMYSVSAQINNIEIRQPLLNNNFQLNTESIFESIDSKTKLIFLCSPNNPSGNLLEREAIESILERFEGLVIIDEAYIDFSSEPGWLNALTIRPNLFIIQTLSKAWGLAGLRIGLGFGGEEVIQILSRIKPPYNINSASQKEVMNILDNPNAREKYIELNRVERAKMESRLASLPFVKRIFPSEANFLLIKVDNAMECYRHLIEDKIVVRDRSTLPLCENCLRVTIGTPEENSKIIESLLKFNTKKLP